MPSTLPQHPSGHVSEEEEGHERCLRYLNSGICLQLTSVPMIDLAYNGYQEMLLEVKNVWRYNKLITH